MDKQREQNFWGKVSKSPLPNGCWDWTGSLYNGYGYFRNPGGTRMAHRISWLLSGRELVAGLVLDHLCFNRKCVNPDHLREITRAENAGRHKPSCSCSVCNPKNYTLRYCKRGHDKSLPGGRKRDGRCAECARIVNQKWMRDYRRKRA